jgi:hypothetical protein
MTIAFKQHAESIKANNDPPQPYGIVQEDRDRRSLPLQMLEEGILKTMNIAVCHLGRLAELSETFLADYSLAVHRQLTGGPSKQVIGLKLARILAPRAGFEPATNRLTAGCSTAELPGTITIGASIRL